MTQELLNKKVAVLIADGFEQVEMTKPQQALEQASAQTQIISPQCDAFKGKRLRHRVQGWNHLDKGDYFPVDVSLDGANLADYDALLLPGSVANSHQLRTNDQAVQLVKSFFDAGKPVAVICHGPWNLSRGKGC